ncbi:ABC transporter permease [Rhizobium sp. RHZ02]|uniref:ABC transporter permease n=1 Tax=Rhizobium sp. RHZ02 TaxID=2769306 RepID=UPI00177EAE3A|nr:ABC transporter permease [Rhizobium sp. RHZ02]MBD9454482.1 ABC transporter permease [Rhizobium sp. RHZ02]
MSEHRIKTVFRLLWRDKFAFVAAIILTLTVFSALFGPWLLGRSATMMNLRARNAPPFDLSKGFEYILGADSLGRSILARVLFASQTTIMIAAAAVICSLVIGTLLGLIAGYRGGLVGEAIMRVTDIVMSFPSLLLALVVLYVFSPAITNVIIVLAITRVPIYLRTTRAEVMEIRSRMFVIAAEVTGASTFRLVFKHILPIVAPTLITIMTLDFAFVMLAEASLSFLGLGVQAPNVTWGVMVAEGRAYLSTAWWLSFWPGLAIALVTMSLNLVSNWLRIATDPVQRWRLEKPEDKNV